MSAPPTFAFAGQQFEMLADRALFWPRHGALIVADLHLEKASWYAALGQPLPPYDSHDTLDRLAALAAETGARAIWCLGDSFHDRHAAARIVPAVAERLARQAASARLLWVAGNHDGLTGGAWGGEVADELGARDAARNLGTFPSQIADQCPRPADCPALFRGRRAAADSAGLRQPDRRPGRRGPGHRRKFRWTL